MAGEDHETCTEVGDVASICRRRGADGSASGITKAEVVLFDDSTDAVLVTVTTFVSYKRVGSRFVKRTVRARVVSDWTTPLVGLRTMFVNVEGLID